MSERVVVTGVGVVAAAVMGGWDTLVAYLEASRPRLTSEDDPSEVDESALAAVMDEAETRRLSRVCRITLAATRLALADAGLGAGSDLGLVIGTEFGDLRSTVEFADGYLDRGHAGLSALLFPSTVMNTMAATTAIGVGARAASLTLNASAVAGELAVARAAAAIASGRTPRMIAGGVDESDPLRRRILREVGASVGAHGDGATLLVLESLAGARARGARILGEVCGTAWGALPAPPHGVGRTASSPVIAGALRAAGVAPHDIGWVYSSARTDLARARWEHAVLDEAFSGRALACLARGPLGGEGTGAGALSIAAAAWTARTRRLPQHGGETPVPVTGRGLVHGLARGGTQVALVIGHGEHSR